MIQVELPLTGQCFCGSIHYELRVAPYWVHVCHCQDCKRQSGSAFGMSMPAPSKYFSIVKGEPQKFERKLDDQQTANICFCGRCGTRLYSSRETDFVIIRPGTLDDTSWLVPTAQFWEKRSMDKLELQTVQSFRESPQNITDLANRWHEIGVEFVERK